jgi:hypothetical protein
VAALHSQAATRLLALAGALLIAQHGTVLAEPTTSDCLNANDRSIALRNQHQLRASRSQLLICATPSCPQEIREECVRRVAEVNAQLPTIVFEVRDLHGNDLSAVMVALDGRPWVDRLDGTALQIDPGEHQFVFKTLDGPSLTRRWIIREGEKGRRELVVLGSRQTSQGSAPPPPSYAASLRGKSDPTAAVDTGSSHGAQRVIGVIVAGLGVAGLGIALYEQVVAHSRASSSQSAADSPNSKLRATSNELYQQANQAQTYAIIFGAAGAVALGTGLVLFITGLGDSDTHETANVSQRLVPSFGPDGGALHYVATF